MISRRSYASRSETNFRISPFFQHPARDVIRRYPDITIRLSGVSTVLSIPVRRCVAEYSVDAVAEYSGAPGFKFGRFDAVKFGRFDAVAEYSGTPSRSQRRLDVAAPFHPRLQHSSRAFGPESVCSKCSELLRRSNYYALEM